jgi:hypothetical protein
VVIPDWAKESKEGDKPAVAAQMPQPGQTLRPEQDTRPDIPKPVIASGKDDTLSPRKSPAVADKRLWVLAAVG